MSELLLSLFVKTFIFEKEQRLALSGIRLHLFLKQMAVELLIVTYVGDAVCEVAMGSLYVS